MRLAIAGTLLAVALLVAACGGDDDDRSSKIFVAPPWTGAETLEYNLEQKGVDNEATCTLTTEPSAADTILTRSCSDNRGYRDSGRLVVARDTLAPRESRRTTFDVEDSKETTYSVAYVGQQARFEVRSGNRSRDTTRDLPKSTPKSPDPGWYDDESVLWLVRGISLIDGFEGYYTHVINAGQPRVLSVKVEVQGQERVDVPAGEFRAWRVRVSREKTVYTYWVDEAPEHRVVRAQIEDSTYELTRAQ